MAKNLDLYIDQGSDFLAVLPPVTKPDNTIQNLSTYTVQCLIRRSYSIQYAVAVTAVVSNAVGGIITLSMDNTVTAGLAPTRWVYDVIITDTNTNFVTKVFEGMAFVNPAVTSKPNTSLITPYVPDDYGGI